jgi:hypothetical protein
MRETVPTVDPSAALRLLIVYLLGASGSQPLATIVGMLVVQRS